MRILTAWFITCILVSLSCTSIDELELGKVHHMNLIESKRPISEPDAIRLQSDDLIMVFRMNENSGSLDGKILVSRSKNQGKSWSEPDTIIQSTMDCRMPRITQLKDGLILVLTTLYRHQKGEPAGCFIVQSFDRGLSFTVPRLVPLLGLDGIAASGSIIELSDGYLLMPVYGYKIGQGSSVMVLVSKDRGENWDASHVIIKENNQDSHFRNPVIVQTKNGEILCMMETGREDGFLYYSVSKDNGESWSPVQRSSIYGWNYDLAINSEGMLICIYCDTSPEGISCSRSYDCGASWEQETSITDRLVDTMRPSLFQIRKDRIAVCTAEYKDDAWSIRATVFPMSNPSKPRGFSASTQGKRGVHLRWNWVNGASYYLLYRGTAPDFIPEYGRSGNRIATPHFPKFYDTEVDSGSTYYYRVSAVCGRGKLIENTGNQSEISDLLTVLVQ
jgi:hypothetical protein